MRLVASGVGKAHGDLAVLDGIDLDVGPGEIVAIIGPSGCGKSTLLRILGGLERADAGDVRAIGAPPPDSLNPVTFVFQDFALLPWRSVFDNVALPLEARRLSGGERGALVRDALARMGLEGFADAFPKHLSGGMKQRVGLARALVVRPAILLLDEPLSALDAQTRLLMMEELRALMANARFAGVYVTHNLDEAVMLADRVLVLSRRPGRSRAVIPVATPREARRIDDPALAALRGDIWGLLRDDARAAEREALT